MNHSIFQRILKKANQSPCTFKVAAVGISKKGEILSFYTNKKRFLGKYRGTHAEMQVMLKSPKSLKTIIICRVGNSGDLLPIHPCTMCQEKANELGIKIVTIDSI